MGQRKDKNVVLLMSGGHDSANILRELNKVILGFYWEDQRK